MKLVILSFCAVLMTSLSCIRNVDTTVQSNPESHYDCSLIKDTMLFVFSPSQFYILPDENTLKEIRGSITFEDVGDQVEDRLVVNAIDSITRVPNIEVRLSIDPVLSSGYESYLRFSNGRANNDTCSISSINL